MWQYRAICCNTYTKKESLFRLHCDSSGEIMLNLYPDNQYIISSVFCISNIRALFGLHRCSLFCVQGNAGRCLFAHKIL